MEVTRETENRVLRSLLPESQAVIVTDRWERCFCITEMLPAFFLTPRHKASRSVNL